MLCDECQHPNGEFCDSCDYDSETDTCKFNDEGDGMTLKIKLDEKAILPSRAHPSDAGLDIYSPYYTNILPKDSVTIDSGIHVAIPKGYVGFLKSKSGLNVKHGITSEGVIDAGYTGSIAVKLYNNSDKADFWHEIVHGIFSRLGYKEHDEKRVEELAQSFYALVKDNPEMFIEMEEA